MATNKPLPARVPPKMPAYRWADWCATCGLSRRPWPGCDDEFHGIKQAFDAVDFRVHTKTPPSVLVGPLEGVTEPLGGPS